MTKIAVKRLGFVIGLLGLLIYVTSPSNAGFGAIAFSSSNGSLGFSYGHASRLNAELRALGECRNRGGIDCRIVVWESIACAALATGAEKRIW